MNQQPNHNHGELDPLMEPRDHCNAWDLGSASPAKTDAPRESAHPGKLDPAHQLRDCANAWDTSVLS